MSTAIFEPGPSVAAPGAVVDLDAPEALDPALVGAKAAARARRVGLPVLPGRVATTGAFLPLADADAARPVDTQLRAAWSVLSESGSRPVVVRASSTVEDGRTSSTAGMFTSVLDVSDWPSFRRAVDTVLESAKVVALADAGARYRVRAPMAVLTQRRRRFP